MIRVDLLLVQLFSIMHFPLAIFLPRYF